MSVLEQLVFEDLVLCFYGRQEDFENKYWRSYFLFGDKIFKGYMEGFPENEICDDIREVWTTEKCGCCSSLSYENANYIK